MEPQNKKSWALVAGLSLVLLMSGCGGGEGVGDLPLPDGAPVIEAGLSPSAPPEGAPVEDNTSRVFGKVRSKVDVPRTSTNGDTDGSGLASLDLALLRPAKDQRVAIV